MRRNEDEIGIYRLSRDGAGTAYRGSDWYENKSD
jgi:hypothetical protein